MLAEIKNLEEDNRVAAEVIQKGEETADLEKEDKTYWHCLVGEMLKILLEPVGIEVRTEVPVVPAPPVADLILIQRKKVGERGWTSEATFTLGRWAA